MYLFKLVLKDSPFHAFLPLLGFVIFKNSQLFAKVQ